VNAWQSFEGHPAKSLSCRTPATLLFILGCFHDFYSSLRRCSRAGTGIVGVSTSTPVDVCSLIKDCKGGSSALSQAFMGNADAEHF